MDASASPLPRGPAVLQNVKWLHHDHVGYLFPAGGEIHLSAGEQTGRWSDLGSRIRSGGDSASV